MDILSANLDPDNPHEDESQIFSRFGPEHESAASDGDSLNTPRDQDQLDCLSTSSYSSFPTPQASVVFENTNPVHAANTPQGAVPYVVPNPASNPSPLQSPLQSTRFVIVPYCNTRKLKYQEGIPLIELRFRSSGHGKQVYIQYDLPSSQHGHNPLVPGAGRGSAQIISAFLFSMVDDHHNPVEIEVVPMKTNSLRFKIQFLSGKNDIWSGRRGMIKVTLNIRAKEDNALVSSIQMILNRGSLPSRSSQQKAKKIKTKKIVKHNKSEKKRRTSSERHANLD